MPILVYCPTCRHKISENAHQCPNCGETQFYRSVVRTVKRQIPCNECEGRGWVWRRWNPNGVTWGDVPYGKTYFKITAPTKMPGYKDFWTCTAYFPAIESKQEKEYLEKCMACGEFMMKCAPSCGRFRSSFTLYYGHCACVACGGKGYALKNVTEKFEEDIRKPVNSTSGNLSEKEAEDILSGIDFDC